MTRNPSEQRVIAWYFRGLKKELEAEDISCRYLVVAAINTSIQINANLVWATARLPSGVWIGICDPLGITVEADNEEDLRSVIQEAHHTLFVDLLEDGELAKFLADRGWKTQSPIPQAIPEEGVRFEVPFRTVSASLNGNATASHQ